MTSLQQNPILAKFNMGFFMPDITMCKGDSCPLKKKCFRNQAIPGKMQSYFMKAPYPDGACKFFSEIDEDQLLNNNANKPIE